MKKLFFRTVLDILWDIGLLGLGLYLGLCSVAPWRAFFVLSFCIIISSVFGTLAASKVSNGSQGGAGHG